jgi:hypothetical protein
MEYRLALNRPPEQQQQQPRTTSTNNDGTTEGNDATGHSRQQASHVATVRGAGAAVLVMIIVYTGSALGVAIPTQNMDRRAESIIVGVGRILSAFLFGVFSVEIPKWMGVTYSSQRDTYNKRVIDLSTISNKELSFRVCWSMLGHFFVVYCILLLYFCNPGVWTIPLSTASKSLRKRRCT